MAYTVEITDGSTTYTFGVDAVPKWGPSIESEYDETKHPAVMTKRVDTIELADCSYRNATPSNVTSDWTSIAGQLFDRTSPITSVVLKDGGTPIFTVSTSTHDSIMVVSLKEAGDHGSFATHWRGTIVLRATKLLADGDGIVRKVRKYSYGSDQHGFRTQRLDVEMVTAPGTSVATKLADEALELPSSKWVFTTNNPDYPGIDIVVDEDSEDTHGRGVSEMVEQALSFPSGSNEYDVEVTTEESGDGKELRYVIVAQADTLARAKAIVRSSPAPSKWTTRTTREERRINRVTATYTVAEDEATLRVRSWTLRFAGGGGESEAIRFPSIGRKRRPIRFVHPADVYVFTEDLVVSQRGEPRPEAPSAFAKQDDLETATSADGVTVEIPRASTPSQDVFVRTVHREHRFYGAPPRAADVLARMLATPPPNRSRAFAYEIAEQRRA